jgi:hypothetical protein
MSPVTTIGVKDVPDRVDEDKYQEWKERYNNRGATISPNAGWELVAWLIAEREHSNKLEGINPQNLSMENVK